MAGVDIDKIKN